MHNFVPLFLVLAAMNLLWQVLNDKRLQPALQLSAGQGLALLIASWMARHV